MKTTRGKYEVCVQCKSTKVALAWNSGKSVRVSADTTVTLTHTKTDTTPAKQVLIPKGTAITYATDKTTRQVDARMKLPDGTTYSSRPAASEDATKNYNMLWAGTIAAIADTMPYGAGCNHCHDPHGTGLRYVRQAMLESVAEKGTNPYEKDSPKELKAASAKDARTLTCSQCHVEYTCGKSGVDGIDRDAFGWSKAYDLHERYTQQFQYKQDWKHKLIGQPLIKNQHPETELYWESTHYNAGASCGDCHMPEITGSNGQRFRSHWFTSPFKLDDPKLVSQFETATGVRVDAADNPCRRCHADRTARAEDQQRAFFARQQTVQALLVTSVGELARVKAASDAGAKIDQAKYQTALTAHRKAHVLWENLAVSENSMGFHNIEECMSSMDAAEKDARIAIDTARSLVATP
jgi:nitrite reductase (cytochrome c-552)